MCRAKALDLKSCLLLEALMEFAPLLRHCRCPSMYKTIINLFKEENRPKVSYAPGGILCIQESVEGCEKTLLLFSPVFHRWDHTRLFQLLGLSARQLYHCEALCVSLASVFSTRLRQQLFPASKDTLFTPLLPYLHRHTPALWWSPLRDTGPYR